jgi:putative NADH-flavin reductase
MKIIVFGSTGSVGKCVLKQALDAGYEVTAFARDPSKIRLNHRNLYKAAGDVLNPGDVEAAMPGHDAAVVVLGAGRKGEVRATGTQNVIQAMKTQGISRLICQSTLGAGDSSSNLNFFWKHIMFGWLLKPAFMDHQLQEQYVKQSGLEWTIVRPGAFTDGELTREYRHGFSANDKTIKLKVSRSDVADFLLKQLQDKTYIHKTPGVSY